MEATLSKATGIPSFLFSDEQLDTLAYLSRAPGQVGIWKGTVEIARTFLESPFAYCMALRGKNTAFVGASSGVVDCARLALELRDVRGGDSPILLLGAQQHICPSTQGSVQIIELKSDRYSISGDETRFLSQCHCRYATARAISRPSLSHAKSRFPITSIEVLALLS